MSNTGTTPVLTNKNIEDALVWLVPLFVSLAGFNWATLIPGATNGFFVALALGFVAKLLVGIQQNGLNSWEDSIPTAIMVLTFVSTALSADPRFLYWGTVVGFAVKSLGMFKPAPGMPKAVLVEDVLLMIGAFITAYGTYTGNATLVSAGALLALVGKTAPGLGSGGATVPSTPGSTTPVPSPAPAG